MSELSGDEDWDDGENPQTLRTFVRTMVHELKGVAARKLRGFSASESLTPTGLVNEVYVRLTHELGQDATWENRRHFLNAAAQKMHQLLIDRWRRRRAAVHGGQFRRVDFDDAEMPQGMPAADWSDLHAALEVLEKTDSPSATVIRWHYLLALPMVDVAAAQEISLSTADRARRRGLNWLRTRFESG